MKKAEVLEGYIDKKKYPLYEVQRDRFFIVCGECIHQILTKSISMESDFVVDIKNLCSKIIKSKTYFAFSQPVERTVNEYYQYVCDHYSRYLWYMNAMIESRNQKYDTDDIESRIKVGIWSQLNSLLDRNAYKHVFPAINWGRLPDYLCQDSEITVLVVEYIFDMLKYDVDNKFDVDNIFDNELSENNEDILYDKVYDLMEFHYEEYSKRLEKDKDFEEFVNLYKKASEKLNASWKFIRTIDSDTSSRRVQGTLPDDFVSKQELAFLKNLYALIYNKLLPSTNLEWYDVDEKIVDSICGYIEELAEYTAIYRYVNANYVTLWNVIDDIKNRLKYPVARHICKMINQMNLDISTYHAIYKKLNAEKSNNNDSVNDILKFEKLLHDAYNCFQSKLANAYDSVLEDNKYELDLEALWKNKQDESESENE